LSQQDQAGETLLAGTAGPGAEKAAGQAAPPALEIIAGQAEVTAGTLKVSAQTSPQAVKVLVRFGEKAVMLSPRAEGLWQGEIPIKSLPEDYSYAKIVAFDIKGNTSEFQLADFSKKLAENFSVLGVASFQNKVSFLGRTFSPKDLESKFYLAFVAAILTCLVLAIGIRRHVQHLSLIANSSFVAILAILLWLGT
jgi:hypothetical protein